MLHSYTRGLLFHYTTKERAIENIFSSMTLRMGSMKATNDPRETEPWFFGMSVENEEVAPSGEEFMDVTRKIDRLLKRSCLIACLTQDAPDPRPELGDPDYYVRFDLGLQGYEHDRMWAQYAGNHTGLCLFFDREKLVGKMEKHFRNRNGLLLHGPVDYVSQITPPNSPFHELSYDEIERIGVEAYTRQHRERFARQLYFTKNPDWASEQEYRFVWLGEDEKEESEAEYVSIQDCVSAICVGTHFPEVYKLNVRDIKDRQEIRAYRIQYAYGKLIIGPAFPEDLAPTPAAPTTVEPDPNFGEEGVARTRIGEASDAHCGVLLPSGKILAAGGTSSLSHNGMLRNEGFALARYSAEGCLDTTFGENGVVVTRVGAFHNGAQALALDPDGNIVAAGTSRVDRSGAFTLARYDTEGNLDETFGEGGTVTTKVGTDAELYAVTLQADGKIVAGGTSRSEEMSPSGRLYRFTLVRFTQDGRVDPTFGEDGITATTFFGANDGARAVTVQPDSKIVAAGSCQAADEHGFAMARYRQDGSSDPSFGQGGKVSTLWGAVGGLNHASALTLQRDGRLVVAGQVHDGDGYAFALARYDADGRPDETFGQEGVVKTPVGNTGMAYANAVMVQLDSRIVCAGYADGHFAFVRYEPDGALDPTFGDGGLGTTNLGGQNGAQALLLQPDGKFVAVGADGGGTDCVFALARYLTDARTDSAG